MNQTKRLLFHIVLWLILWLTVMFLIEDDVNFLKMNGPSFLMQIVVIAVLIYVTAPALLFKKKYLLFAVISLVLIAFCAFLITYNLRLPSDGPPPFPDHTPPGNQGGPMPGGRPKAPPPIFNSVFGVIHCLCLGYVRRNFFVCPKKEEETIRNKNENLQNELKLLKSQINPHFLFNALNNIYALSAIDSGRTQQSISYLSDMLRYVLYECEQELVPLEKEITYIENYIKLFKLKSSKTYPIFTDFNLDDKTIKVAPMLFIPFMENALKHSTIEKIKDSFIKLKIWGDHKAIHFEIENSKSESPKIVDEVGGIGIENVKKRLAILYPNQHKLLINETSQAYKVNLNINLSGNN